MSKIDECGNIQYHKVTRWESWRYRLKAWKLRLLNWDAEKWYRKYGK